MRDFELLLVLLSVCVALAAAAQRLKLPVAVMLVLGGMGLAFIPGLPPLTLDPALVMALFLPPLLQLSAYRTDWPAFHTHLRPILLLAIGAVFFTAALVAVATKLLVPDLPWWAAITLGAIVAPPDAVAASSILRQFRLPKRIVTVLEGESLINDASSLVLYKFAVAAVGLNTVSYGSGLLQFFAVALGGAAIGWAVGRVAMWIFSHLDDTLLDITVNLLTGFAAYLGAEALGGSGVLAAVACGFVLGRQQHAEFSAQTRLELSAVWGFLEFVLTSLVFVLIGLQMRGITARLANYDMIQLLLLTLALSTILIVGRFVWVFPATWVPRALFPGLRERDPLPPWSHATVISWTGMRGVVSLAAALALPEGFPGRDLILFLAFCSIFVTLVIQGTSLGWVIRRLGLTEPETLPEPDTAQARAEMATAALEAVRQHLDDANIDRDEQAEAAAELVEEYEVRAERASVEGQDVETKAEQLEAQQRLRMVAIEAAREVLAGQADELDVEAHRALGEELDLEEQQVRRALGKD